ncbi:MAG: fused response regulator/phosphatase [Candidatus Hydrogenedentes bacterium]|nr:fused response regulator/phosphatase [Candidatus Hydrogenedentota bacterium]
MAVEILVVDDEPDLQTLIRQRFRRQIRAQEYLFYFAGNGEEALDTLRANENIEVILTDINMPKMDGLTLLGELASWNTIIKSVVISAYGDMNNIRTAMNRGAFDFITKPIDFRDLEITLEKTLHELYTLKEGEKAKVRLLHMDRELEVATRIQASILPKIFPPFPHRTEFDIYALMRPAREVGGDFYDFFFVDDTHLGLVIGDVAGKGVPAAILMAVSRTLLKATALTGVSPGECVSHTNKFLCSDNESGLFVTLFYAILDTISGEVAYCNAGHNPPCLIRAAGNCALLENQGGLVLGILDDAHYETTRIQMASGDLLFLYTDGVTEAMDSESKCFTDDRLRQCLELAGNHTAQSLTETLLADILHHANGHPQHDDITTLALRYLKGD